MISRGSNNAPNRLRKAKSSSWAQPSHHASPQSRGIDPETAHQQAVGAAVFAFELASERANGAQCYKENGSGQGLDAPLGIDNGQRLERKQSVRFTGPTAVPLRNRSITRRVVPSSNVSHGSPRGRQSVQHVKMEHVLEGHDEASPPKGEKFTEKHVSSLPTSYRRLRKARSMFSSRDSGTGFFTNGTPQKRSRVRSQTFGFHSDDGHQFGRPNPRLQRSFSFLRGEMDNLTSSNNNRAGQDAAIKFARDQYLHQLEQQRIKEEPSLLALRKSRGPQKAFRKTVRTGSSNSYGPAIASSNITSTEHSIKSGFGHKARDLSLLLKNKLKRVFHRPSDVKDSLPIQQLHASRPHFGDQISPSSGVNCYVPSPDQETRDSTLFFERNASLGGIRSVQSDSEMNNGKSRVTSWTDSTIADTVTSHHLPEKKRLSIIREHRELHQSSPVTRTYADLGNVFQKPIRISGSAGSQHSAFVNSQRVYSALQKRISDNQQLTLLQENSLAKGNNTGEGEVQTPEHQQIAFSSHMVESGVKAGLIHDEGAYSSLPLVLKNVVTSNADDLFQSCTQNFSNRKSQQQLLEMYNRPSPQQIPEHDEYSNLVPKRPLREIKSAFFPSSMRIERRSTSPFRRIMDTSSEDGPGMEAGIDESIQPRTDHSFVYRSAPNQVSSGSVIGSASLYSRTSSGNTPKRMKSLLSLTRSDSSEEPGTAVIITPKPKENNRSPESFIASSKKLSGNWQEWIESETAQLENDGAENIKISSASFPRGNGHRREAAQIDGEDTKIGGLGANNLKPKQPIGIIQGRAVSRPILQHHISRPISKRHPLVEIKKPTMSINHDYGKPTSKSYPATPPDRSLETSLAGTGNSSCVLRHEGSYGSLLSQRSSSSRRQKSGIDETNDSIDPQAMLSSIGLNRKIQGKEKESMDHSHERIALIHRMQSKNVLPNPNRIEPDKNPTQNCDEKENQNFIDPNPFALAQEDKELCAGANLISPVMYGNQPKANRKLVDLFLSNRRRNLKISEESADAVFL